MRTEGSGALVTGGASGLGEATVRRLHAGGAHVAIADMNAGKGEALAAELGERAAFLTTDVTDEASVQAAVEAAAEAPGGLRIAAACAGIGWAERTAGKSGPHQLQPFETVVRVNLIGVFNTLRLAAAAMNASEPLEDGERGVVVTTASAAAFEGQIGQLAYSSSKGGVVAMTLPAARDLGSRGIRVMCIAPGTFDTPLMGLAPEPVRESLVAQMLFPARMGDPGEFAALVAHIVENRMLTGGVIRLDGGQRMPPR